MPGCAYINKVISRETTRCSRDLEFYADEVMKMKAIQFRFSWPRYGLNKFVGLFSHKGYYGPHACLLLNKIPEPRIMGPRWVRLRSLLSGFCGSDLGIITLRDHPTTQPFASFPMTLGHENVSIVEEVGEGVTHVSVGDRVLLDPALCCEVREIDPLCKSCQRGEKGMCENFAEGNIAPGIDVGICTDTGGGWGEYYLAHESQLYKVPDSWSDEAAMMIEPLCSSLHPVMRARPQDEDKVMVFGCGVIGLGVIAAIRGLGIKCHITAVEVTELNVEKAKEFGADEVIMPNRESLFERAASITGAKRYKPLLAQEICMGGFDQVFDTVGSTKTINSSLRLLGGEGTYVLIGIQIPLVVDWTPVWMKGLTIIGNLGYGMGDYQGKRMYTFDIAMDLVDKGKIDMTSLVTHKFSLEEYKKAIEVNLNKVAHDAIKTAFEASG